MTSLPSPSRRLKPERHEMPTIAWLVLGAGAWLAAVGAICALLSVAKRADAQLPPPARAIADIAAVCPQPSGLSGPLGPRPSAASSPYASREPRPARPVIASVASGAATPLYVLHRGARVIGSLEWRARSREAPGWYLRRGARPARRLELDIALDGFADRSPSNRQAWQQCAHAAATLSTPLALDAADRALRGGLPAPPPGPLEPGAFQVHVTGLDLVTVALSC